MPDAGPGDDTDAAVDDSGVVGTGGSSGTAATFDPTKAYLFAPVKSGWNAIAPITDPQADVLGIDNGLSHIEMLNQGFIYEEPGGSPIYSFAPDYTGVAPLHPAAGKANDTKLDVTPCAVTDRTGPNAFLSNPTGRFIYQCEHGGPWYESGAQIFSGKQTLIALGNADLALAHDDLGTGVVNLTDETYHVSSVPFIATGIQGKRATATGFDVAYIPAGSSEIDLLHIDAQGSSKVTGKYPDVAVGVSYSSSVLMPDGTLIQLATLDGIWGIYTRPIKASSSLIYMEMNDPYVRLGGATLVTGP